MQMKLLLSFICCLCLIDCMYGQYSTNTAEDDAIKNYLQATQDYASIYNGMEEPRYRVRTTNDPYLNTAEFRKGTLHLNGCIYPDVMMRLNKEKELLVVLSPNGKHAVIVPKERFESARIDSLFITYQKPRSADGRLLPEGYYIRIYEGENQVWVREVSYLSSEVQNMELIHSFKHQKRIFIRMADVYHPVNSKSAVLKLFASHKKELKKMLRQAEIKFREDPEKAIVAMTTHYDKLNK